MIELEEAIDDRTKTKLINRKLPIGKRSTRSRRLLQTKQNYGRPMDNIMIQEQQRPYKSRGRKR
jgi:hypothetical protein